MSAYHSMYLVPLLHMIPAVVAFYIAFILRQRYSGILEGGLNYRKILYYLCLAEGFHNSYYFIAALLRNYDTELYETMMHPVPWLFAQGIIAFTFLAFAFYFTKERDIEQNDVKSITELANRFRELAFIDPLTNLNNRRSMDDILEKEQIRAKRVYRPYTLMMLDMDGFKAYNDTHGHQAGDLLLTDVAQTMKSELRNEFDRTFRYGGDEFFIIMPETVLSEARKIALRINEAIKSLTDGKITLSIGLLEISPDCAMKTDEMIRLTDIIMYNAKRDGGNQVACLTA